MAGRCDGAAGAESDRSFFRTINLCRAPAEEPPGKRSDLAAVEAMRTEDEHDVRVAAHVDQPGAQGLDVVGVHSASAAAIGGASGAGSTARADFRGRPRPRGLPNAFA